jgi:nucleoside-diphosphate-sugar epimerase
MSHKDKGLRVALVTGATGYIGSNLVKRMVSDHWQVHIVVRRGSNLEALTSVLDQIVVHEHNGTTKNMIDIVFNSNPEIIFHLASLFIAQHKPEDLEGLIVSNIMFSTQIVEAAVHCKIKYLINTSTSWQHFENKEYSPVNLYAASKQAFEDILKYYVSSSKLKVISLVLFDTFGPNDDRFKLIPLLIRTLKTQEMIEMSKGGQLIDLVYIDDVIDAYLLCAKQIEIQNESYLRYAVSSFDPLPLTKIVKLFELTFNKKLNISWGVRPYRINEVMVPWNKYTKIPGWMPKYSIKTGLQKMINETNC